MSNHIKIHGYVDEIEGSRWWAQLAWYPHGWAYAEMSEPLPDHARRGSTFTIHLTKAGRRYIYWITKPLITKRQLKHARCRAREWTNAFAKART